ncbi:2'-5' RNA ligase [Paenibacillus selenitireducens]|uniref:RNA 2',3'-cyclic phosphodiesterase n=2 Tax=Paenibacillus selenitireducens TaxID=1324314 RepID=A0A1T2XG12_9BACL|nr:2'-5' RNA ligase [Paenibacillus selenitireducens]
MGEPSVRLFVAVPLSKQAREALEQWTGHAKAEIPFQRWVHPLDYHITLQFLGDTKPDQLGSLIEGLRAAVSTVSPLELSLKGIGTFGRDIAPRILWAGVGGDTGGLEALLKQVQERTKPLGFISEDRPYRPHITLAKKYGGDTPFAIDLLDSNPLEPITWLADRIILYQTHMAEQPMYEGIETFPFTR